MQLLRALLILTCSTVVFSEFISDTEEIRKVPEDAKLKVPELVRKYGYPLEVHKVYTEDGYILEMHRIPYGLAEGAGPSSGKPVVLVVHGLTLSSADFVLAGPENSLGYLLADQGYDVWLGNARGNRYSRNHTILNPDKKKFWEFSWHEIGVYDVPAMIDYALSNTNQEQLLYIGHSQGTTSFYVMASERPEYNQKIRAMFSLAPVAYTGNMISPVMRFLASFHRSLYTLTKIIGIHEFRPNANFLSKFVAPLCSKNSPVKFICSNVLFLICGFNPEQSNAELLPIIMGHTPAGCSARQPFHYAQLFKAAGKFRQFDHGLIKNLIKYKKITPPSYDLSKVTAPVTLIYSHNDWLAAEKDVLKLNNTLPNVVELFLVPDKKFNHLDFLYAKDVVTLLYNNLLRLMRKY